MGIESFNDELRSTAVSDGIVVFEGHYEKLSSYSGGNVTSTVVHSGKDAIVFDSLMHPKDTARLIHGIKKLNLNITGLVNTHWHWDHTAGNQMFFETKRIISHSLSIDLMKKLLTWDDFNNGLKKEEKIRTVFPTETYYAAGTKLPLGLKEVDIIHAPGHTPDSIVGWLKEENVIIAGDTVMELPFVGYGNSRDLFVSLKKVSSLAGNSGEIIQGHGGICRAEKIGGDLEYIENVRRKTAEYASSGKSLEKAAEDIKLEDCVPRERFEELSSNYKSFLWCHPKNVKRIYAEFQS